MKLLTFPELEAQKGHPFTREHTRRLIKAGKFPAPIQVGARRIAWSEEEVDAHYKELAERRSTQAA